MSSQPHTAASAASFAANVPLREPCVAFASRAVQAFFARCGRMAAIKPDWLTTSSGATGATERLREVELPALADPTLEAIEDMTTSAAMASTVATTVEDILFAPIDAATLDASMVGGACAFRGHDDATTAEGDATAWSESVCPSACMVAAAATTTNEAVHVAAAADDETLLLEDGDGHGDGTSDDAQAVVTADEGAATTTAAETAENSEELPTLELVDDVTTATADDELPTLELVAEATATEAEAVAEELESVAGSTGDDAPAAASPFRDDGATPDDLLVAARHDDALVASATTAPDWPPESDGGLALLEPTHADDLAPTPPTATDWSPEADSAAAVAVAEPVAAIAVAEQPATAPAVAAAAVQAVGGNETTTPPASTPATARRTDTDLEQVQHHMLTALEQVQTNLTAALEQLRAVTPPDVTPALTEVRAELGRQGELLAANVAAVKQLDERVGGLGEAVQQARAASAQPAAATATAPLAPVAETVSLHAPLAVAALGATWSVLLWWKTGSTALAAGTLVAANLVAGLWLGRGRG